MSNHTINLNEELYAYLLANSLREHEVLTKLREETSAHKWAGMQISPEQGQFMALLVSLTGARNIIELGVYTGYSSLSMALALPEDGRLLACDINKDYTDIAQKFWKEAGVADKIELRLAPALETLTSLLESGERDKYDFVFVDAIKEEYLQYYEILLKLIRRNGLILVDNVLWGGSVANPDKNSPETIALRKFNDFVYRDKRVDISMLPLGDGLTIIRKI